MASNGGVRLVTGFVLIRTMPGMEHEVYSRLLRTQHVQEVFHVFGDCDIVAKVVASDYQALGDVVVDIIRSGKGVVWTKTLVTCML